MKIYMPTFSINNFYHKIESLETYYDKSSCHNFLYANDGIYSIYDKYVEKIIPIDKEPITYHLNNTDLIVDDSYFKKEKIYSYIPNEHTLVKKTYFHYCNHTNKMLELVVEGTYKNLTIDTTLNSRQVNDKYYNFVADDIYFVSNENIDNTLLKKELNMFISLLY